VSNNQTAAVESNLSKFTPWIFFLNTFSQQFGITITLQFMNMFMTEYARMDPMVLAGVLSAGRVIDAALSFVAGALVQKANLKTGPYRTWILINGPIMTVGVFLIFLNPDVSQGLKLIIFVIGYLCRNCPQNFLLAAQATLIGKVAGTNMSDRLALTAKGTQGSSASGIIVGFITIYIIEFFNNSMGGGRGYLLVGTVYCLIQSVIQFIIYRALAPYDQYDPNLKNVQGSSANVKTTAMYTDTLTNPQIWILLLSNIFRSIATFTLTPMTTYIMRHSIGNITALSSVNTSASIFALAVAFLIPPVAKKIGKKNSQVISAFGCAAGYVIMALFGDGNLILIIALTMWNRASTMLSTTIGINNYLDAAEYQLFKTGRDSRPFIMGLSAIVMKVAQTISSFTTSWVLIFAGYQSLGAGQATVDNAKLVLGSYGLIAALYVASAVTMMLFSISESKAKEYAEANKKMLEERAAATAKQ